MFFDLNDADNYPEAEDLELISVAVVPVRKGGLGTAMVLIMRKQHEPFTPVKPSTPGPRQEAEADIHVLPFPGIKDLCQKEESALETISYE